MKSKKVLFASFVVAFFSSSYPMSLPVRRLSCRMMPTLLHQFRAASFFKSEKVESLLSYEASIVSEAAIAGESISQDISIVSQMSAPVPQ